MSVRPRALLLTRREILATLGKTTLAFPVLTAVVGSGCGSAPNQPHTPSTITDDQFLDNLEKASFLFFWEQTRVATGLVKDRAFAAGKDSRTLSSIVIIHSYYYFSSSRARRKNPVVTVALLR